jgi:tRNA(Ile)-lysidine synthase
MVLKPVQRKVLQYARKHGLLPDGAAAVVGLSGGPDSVALLRLLHSLNAAGALNVSLTALHLNHMIRGSEADADAVFSGEVARRLGVPIIMRRVDVPRFARSRSLSMEEAARRVRYDVFRAMAVRLARKNPRARIVITLGHHADDQVETVLHRIIRGTGIKGLAGIPAKRPLEIGRGGRRAFVARPLLCVRRAEILDYLRETGQPFRVDSSNAGVKFTRNRLRNELLPLLRGRYNPAVDAAIQRLADIARRWSETAEKQIAPGETGRFAAMLRKRGTASVPLDMLAGPEGRAQMLLKRVLELGGMPLKEIGKRHYTALMELARMGRRGAQLHLPGIRAVREANAIRLEKNKAGPRAVKSPRRAVQLPLNRSATLPDGTRIFCREESRRLQPKKQGGFREVIDMDSVSPPLTVRFPAAGDAFQPLGAPGRKKVLQFLAERKVPVDGRSAVPLVTDKKGIIWVVGHRIADRVKITPATRRVLLLSSSKRGK